MNLYTICCKDSHGNLRLVKFKANYLMFLSLKEATDAVKNLKRMSKNKFEYKIVEFEKRKCVK